MNNICQWQVARKTQSSTSWRPIINETKANVVLEKHTIQYNIRKKHMNKKNTRRQSLQKRTKVDVVSFSQVISVDSRRRGRIEMYGRRVGRAESGCEKLIHCRSPSWDGRRRESMRQPLCLLMTRGSEVADGCPVLQSADYQPLIYTRLSRHR